MRSATVRLLACVLTVSLVGVMPARVADAAPASAGASQSLVDLRVGRALIAAPASPVLPTATVAWRSDRARAFRALAHRRKVEAANSAAELSSRLASVAALPQLVDPPVPVASGVTDWSKDIQRGGGWYATTVQKANGWTILRSPDGLTWTDIGLPAGFPSSSAPKIGIDASGGVYTARTIAPSYYAITVLVARFQASWLQVASKDCYVPSVYSESVSSVLVSGANVAVVTARLCLVTSTNSGATWSTGKSLSSGTTFYLEGTILHVLTCQPTGATASAYGRFGLASYAGLSAPSTPPLVGCTTPTFVGLGGTAVALISFQRPEFYSAYGRAYIISVSANSGAAWSTVAAGEPPRARSRTIPIRLRLATARASCWCAVQAV